MINKILARINPFLKIAVFLSLFILLFTLVHRGIFDLDIWLHIKAGEWILQHKAIPQNDIFSFTIFNKPWVDHSWLFQILMNLVYKNSGDEGLVFLESLTACLAFLFLLFSYYEIKEYFWTALVLLFSIFACQIRYNIRPDLFSLLFFSIYLFFLRRPLTRASFYILLFIQILWVNFHGYFILGPLLVLILIIQGFLARKFEKRLPFQWSKANSISPANYLKLKRLFFMVILVNLLNPRGFTVILYPLGILTDSLLGRNKIFFQYIQELQPVFKSKFPGSFQYFSLMIVSLAALISNFKRLKFSDLLMWLIFTPFSFIMRDIPYLVFAASHIILSNLKGLRKLSLFSLRRIPLLRKIIYNLAAVVFVVWLVFLTKRALFATYFDFKDKQFKSVLVGTLEDNFPKKGVDFVLKENLPARMFNDFNSGAYLIGRCFPRRKVFLDGRTELYGEGFFGNVEKVLDGDRAAFLKTVKKYRITACFISYANGSLNEKFTKMLSRDPSWTIVYLDESALIFLKDNEENKDLIKKFKIDSNNWKVDKLDVTDTLKFIYPGPYVNRAKALYILNFDDAALKEADEALKIMPNCANALNIKGKILMKRGFLEEAFLDLRAANIYSRGNTDIIFNLGAVYAKMKKYDKAIKFFKLILKRNPRYINTYKELALVYKETGQTKQAAELLSQAIKVYPGNKEVSEELKEKY